MGGLAIARAFGDFAVKKLGVVATPDVKLIPIDSLLCVVLASDGVWDVCSSKEVADAIVDSTDPENSVVDLIKTCLGRWRQEQYDYCDDITCAVVYM